MRYPLMVRAAVVPAALALSLGLAAPAQAYDVSPAQSAAMLQVSDLTGSYGKVTDSFDNDMGKGVIPSTCEATSSGARVIGKPSHNALVNSMTFSRGSMWNTTVYEYATPAKATVSFDQLLARATAGCVPSLAGTIGDAGENIPVISANRVTKLPDFQGMSRFTSATSTKLVDSADATQTYKDSYSYSTFVLDGSSIVQIAAYQPTPLSAAERRDVVRGANRVAVRVAGLG